MLRNKKSFAVGDGETYLMCELTIGNIFALYYTIDSIDVGGVEKLFSNLVTNISLLESITTCPLEVLINLGASELKNIYDLFFEVNNCFFRNKSNKPEDGTVKKEDFVGNLFTLYCGLIEVGHVNVLGYGYSFFIKAINNHEEIRNRYMAEVATAVRIAQYADDKQWKRYMRKLIR